MLAYVHNLSPFLIQFSEKVAVRWYGLSYIAAFAAGILIIRWLAARDLTSVARDKAADFITWGALLGVMVGGRLGYMLFYDWERFSQDPLQFFRILEGGMASHGGILGLVVFTFFYARRFRLSWPGVGDDLVVPAPLGICFGRLANFINGELYGRPTDVPWAMKFPSEIYDGVVREPRLAIPEALREGLSMHSHEILASAREHGYYDALVAALTPRHPSQLYQAMLEGFLLFLILFVTRLRFPKLGYGVLTGIFFLGYAFFRIVAERFREPDAELLAGITRGQFYSVFMVGIGVAFVWYGMTRGKKARLARSIS